MVIGKNEKLVIIGDSVTDCGREYPVGEGNLRMGDGYARNVNALLDMNYPERKIRVVNMGISGERSRDLLVRWQRDVLDLKPDWVCVMIGINDIWRQFDAPLRTEEHVYLEEYGKNLEWMAEHTLPHVKGMIFAAPCYMEQNHSDAMRQATDRYAEVMKKTAEKYGILFADPQPLWDHYFTQYEPIAMSWDRVHPNHTGHMMIAKAIVDAMGFSWQRED